MEAKWFHPFANIQKISGTLESDPFFRQLLMYLFAGTRGAEMRMKIISTLEKTPLNTSQLAKELNVDYKAIQYQLKLLMNNKLVQTPNPESYGALYFLSPLMQKNLEYVKEIWNRYGKSKINRNPSNSGGN